MTLHKARGVGFGFHLTRDEKFQVTRIAEGSPAASDGRLHVGDQIVCVDGQQTKGYSYYEVSGGEYSELPLIRPPLGPIKVS